MAAFHPTEPSPTEVANGRSGGMSCHRHRLNRSAAERLGRDNSLSRIVRAMVQREQPRKNRRQRDGTGKIPAATAPFENSRMKRRRWQRCSGARLPTTATRSAASRHAAGHAHVGSDAGDTAECASYANQESHKSRKRVSRRGALLLSAGKPGRPARW